MISYRLMYRLGVIPWDSTPGTEVLDRVVADVSLGRGRRALDIGCGTGRDAVYLAGNGWDVTGVDLEERALRKARGRMDANKVDVRWLTGDVTDLDVLGLEPGFSLVYDMGCIQGLPDEVAALAANGIAKLAADDATLVFLAFARADRRILPRGMNREHVEALFGPTWRVVETHDMVALSTHKVPPPVRKAKPTAYHLVRA